MPFARTIRSIALLAILYSGGALIAQKFTVVVLDALNSRPQAGVLVNYSCEGQGWSPSDEVRTDNNGSAEVPFPCGKVDRIELSVFAPDWKQNAYARSQCGGLGAISLEEILSAGIVGNPSADGNIWCPTKISRKLKPVPGRVTIFIKKPTCGRFMSLVDAVSELGGKRLPPSELRIFTAPVSATAPYAKADSAPLAPVSLQPRSFRRLPRLRAPGRSPNPRT